MTATKFDVGDKVFYLIEHTDKNSLAGTNLNTYRHSLVLGIGYLVVDRIIISKSDVLYFASDSDIRVREQDAYEEKEILDTFKNRFQNTII